MDEKKIKVLWYGDSPTVQTGFGRVARELLTRLNAMGKYDIAVVGLNDRGEPSEYRNEFRIIPCPDLKEDPYGFNTLPPVLMREKPDVLLTLNDIWVYTGFPENGNVNWFKNMINKVRTSLPVVCYFTIDGKPNAPEWDEYIRWLDVPVVMSDFGEKTVLETAPDVENKLMKAYHGSSVEYFYPLSEEEKKAAREKLMAGRPINDDTFIIGVVSRNQPRKNIPTLLHAFKKYVDGYWVCPVCGYYLSDVDTYCEKCGMTADDVKAKTEQVPGNKNAWLYLHMAVRDARGYKIDKLMYDNRIPNVILRANHDIAHGVPVEELNRIYNAINVMCQPTFAEGYGLPPIEAASAGTAVIATRTTTMVEMFEDGRGELVWPDSIYVLPDAGHCRKHHISEEGLIAAFDKLAKDPELVKEYGKKSREFALTRTWDMAADVIDKALQKAASMVKDVDTLYSQKPNMERLLVMNGTSNPEDILKMTPALKALSHANSEIVAVTNDTFCNLLDGLDFVDESIGSRHAVLKKDELQKLGIKMINLTGVWENYSTAMFPNLQRTTEQVYCDKLGLKCDSGIKFSLTSEERKWAKGFFAPYTDKFTLFFGTAGIEENVYGFDRWSRLLSIIKNMDDTIIITDLVDRRGDMDAENVIFAGDLSLRQQIILAKYCKLLVTCDNIFLMLANKFKGYTIGLAAGRDIKSKCDIDDFTVIAQDDGSFPCWPCNRVTGVKCVRTGGGMSACLNSVKPEEIVGLIARAKKEVM